MPRKSAHPPVTRINPGTIREAFRRPAGSDAGYYILEKGRTLVCLRVRQSSVKIGVRHHSRWYSVAPVHVDMSIQEVETLRLAALGSPASGRRRALTRSEPWPLHDARTAPSGIPHGFAGDEGGGPAGDDAEGLRRRLAAVPAAGGRPVDAASSDGRSGAPDQAGHSRPGGRATAGGQGRRPSRRQPRAPATQLCPGLRSPDGMGVA